MRARQKFPVMVKQLSLRLILSALLALCGPARIVSAQAEPPVGVRAAGMGGAFTAVADDASAAFWNPAGLASGSFFSMAVDWNAVAHAESAVFIGAGSPPLAVAYYRTATGPLKNGRNSLVAHHAGVTLVQSLGDSGLAGGATLKIVRGITAAGDAATRFDVDIGFMKAGALGRIGLTVHNALAPEFGTTGSPIRLERRIRGGASLSVTDTLKVAADWEFTKAATPRGAWRDAALGIEDALTPKAWLRTGVHWNTARLRRSASAEQAGGTTGAGAAPVVSIGASYALRGSLLADAQASAGSANGDRGWGIGLRFVF